MQIPGWVRSYLELLSRFISHPTFRDFLLIVAVPVALWLLFWISMFLVPFIVLWCATRFAPRASATETDSGTGKSEPIHLENILDSLDVNDESVRCGLIDKCAGTLPEMLARIRSNPGRRDAEAYLPGQPKFVCAQANCTNSCCKDRGEMPFQVPVSLAFREAVRATREISDSQFVRIEADMPSLVKDSSGKCVFLDSQRQCTVYDIRPVDCATYPFDLAFFDLRHDGNLAKINHRDLFRRAGDTPPPFFTRTTLGYNCIVPLIIYHSRCPGFTGEPVTIQEYISLVDQIWRPSRRGLLIETLV
jgi:Fe-S-cluster containining protein